MYKFVSSTTNNSGFIDVGVASNEAVLISALKLSAEDNGVMCIPYRGTNSADSHQYVFVFDSTFQAKKNFNIGIVCIFGQDIPSI